MARLPKGFLLRNSKKVSPAKIQDLFRSAGWSEDIPCYPLRKVQRMLAGSHLVLTAWRRAELVGLLTLIGDGVVCAYISNLLVAPAARRRGVGTALLRRAVQELERQKVSLVFTLGEAEAHSFFRKQGFVPLDWSIFLRCTQ